VELALVLIEISEHHYRSAINRLIAKDFTGTLQSHVFNLFRLHTVQRLGIFVKAIQL